MCWGVPHTHYMPTEPLLVREDSLRLTEAESIAPLGRVTTPRAAQRPIITVEGNGVMPTLHLVGNTVYAVTPAARIPPEAVARDQEVCGAWWLLRSWISTSSARYKSGISLHFTFLFLLHFWCKFSSIQMTRRPHLLRC